MLKKAMLLLVCSLLIAALPAGYAYAETESGEQLPAAFPSPKDTAAGRR